LLRSKATNADPCHGDDERRSPSTQPDHPRAQAIRAVLLAYRRGKMRRDIAALAEPKLFL